MTQMTKQILVLSAAVSAALLAGCERPPMDSEQIGQRGTAMVQVTNPRLVPEASEIPEALPPVPQAGPKAGDIYQNVQVLGDLSIAEFTRTMQAITAWVSPEEGCNYCHNPQNLASDDVYTKVVSRRMMQMTAHINAQWESHVGQTGVTCYTCHGGQPVPANIWFAGEEGAGMAYMGNAAGQNVAAPEVGLASLPGDPFSSLLTEKDGPSIRVLSDGWAPDSGDASIQATEHTYALMMHMSGALGVNCTYCHNSNNFADWTNSTPARVTAWHGLEMVQNLNEDYLVPLGPVYPDERLGPTGDAPKAYCTTCHGGLPKPLGGAQMAADYPAFWSR
jgi:photosynthetic reaction center cytochrome c subunit